jgi:hypothetical protein
VHHWRARLLTKKQEGAGFVVDEDEEDEEAERKRRRRKKRKNREVDEALDDEDLDLIGIEPDRPEQEQVWRQLTLLERMLTRASPVSSA